MDVDSYDKENMMKRVLTLLLLALMSPTAQAAPPAEKPGQPLSPETEMAIMRVMNLENRIQTLQTVPVKMTDIELAGHFSGTWICFTTMRLNGQLGRGIMEIRLKQDGDELVGEGGQLKHPFDPPSTIRPIGTRSAAVSGFIGQFKKAFREGTHNMAVIERQGGNAGTWATFTAVLAGDGRTARGTLVNRGGNYGLMFMVRREFLSDFKHLLTEEGRQAEAARRLIGIEKLEATLDTAIMDTTRIDWWNRDKNKDGKLQYSEFSHPDWKRANRNHDKVVDWAEEVSDRVLRKLALEGDFLAKHGNDSQKQWPSIYAWGVAHPGFEQIFHFVDWDRDGKITPAEYTAFKDQLNAYNDPSFPKRNQDGKTREDLRSKKGSGQKSKGVVKTKPSADPHLVQMEAAFSKEKLAKSREMWAALDKNRDNIWQYEEFPHPDWKRANRDDDDGLSWKEELADKMFRKQSRTYPKQYGSTSQKEWPTQQAWNKDRPDFKQLFAFIDWDQDGGITAAEYEIFDVQIKSYHDGSYPKANEQGETGMEVFKRLSAQSPKVDQPHEAGQSRKALAQEVKATDWTEEEWKKDKGTYGWVFPHIDKNSDGKVTAAEYEAFQNYKKKHPNWEIELKANARPVGTKASKADDNIPQGIEALEAALNKERMAQAVEMFEKLDKNKDGRITDGAFPDISGRWIWEGGEINSDSRRTMLFEIKQTANKLQGKTVQVDARGEDTDFSDKSLFAESAELDPILQGKIYGPGTANNNLVLYFVYTLNQGQHGELSAGHVSKNGTLIEGQFSNTIDQGKRGWFVMKKIDAYKNEKIEEWKCGNTEKERREILKLVEQYEAAVQGGDKDGLLSVYLNEHVPVSSLNKNNEVSIKSADEFAESLFNKKWDQIAETLHDEVVHINGNIATLTTSYKWYVDGSVKAKGKKIWMLVKTSDGWKVNHHSWHNIPANVQETSQRLDEDRELSGRWVWEGRPHNDHSRSQNNGVLFMDLNQINQNIFGEAYQFINPGRYSSSRSHSKIVNVDEAFPVPTNEAELNCHINSNGQIFGPFKANDNKLALIQRIQKNRTHLALFTGNILENGKSIEGHFTNTWADGGKGWLVLRKLTNFTRDKGVVYEPYIENLDADRNAILQIAGIYEKNIEAKNREGLSSIYHRDVVISNVTNKDKIKDQSADEFVGGIVGIENEISETLYRKMVRVNGYIASLTAYYDWFNDGKRKHSGSIIFLLAKTNNGWKVIHKNWHNN